MSPGDVSKTPPSSPSSPPRKKAKFSLRLKGKNKSKKDEADVDTGNPTNSFYPVFRSPVEQHGGGESHDCMEVEPSMPSFSHPGLLNRANICYANAVLQVLRRCPGFEQFVSHLAKDIKIIEDATTGKNVKEKNMDPNQLVTGLCKLLCQMDSYEVDFLNEKENCSYLRNKGPRLVLAAEPDDFMRVFRELYPGFESNLQHDAQEFLCSLISALQESADNIIKHSENNFSPLKSKTLSDSTNTCNGAITSYQNPSFIKNLFQGKLVHQTKCMNCEEPKLRYEDVQEISVPVVEDQPYLDARKKLMLSPTPKKNKDDVHTLHWAISQFASSEFLQGDNKYFCENCNTYCEAEIRTCFDELPTVLTVHLKRFASTIGLSSKITSNLKTPLTLSVQEWCSNKCQLKNNVYELFGIVLHSGMTSCSGHYETYVRIPKTQNENCNSEVQNEVVSNLDKEHGINGQICPEEKPLHEEKDDSNLPNKMDTDDNYDNKNDVRLDINSNCVEEMETIISDNKDSKRVPKRKQRSRKAKKSIRTRASMNSTDIIEEETKQAVQEDGPSLEDIKSSFKSQEKQSCISLITKYFHRSKKSSLKSSCSANYSRPSENKECPKEAIPNSERSNSESIETELKKASKGCRTIEDSFRMISKSVQDPAKSSKSATIRKLDFMDDSSEKQENCINDTCQENKADGNSLDLRNHHQNQLGKDWVHFDDCTVNSVSKNDINDVLSASESSFMSPYLLFYLKSDIAE